MSYSTKEIFYTLQGEGANSGRAAVCCRFAGCNLWSGLQRDRSKAVCRFCDTDFRGTDGEKIAAQYPMGNIVLQLLDVAQIESVVIPTAGGVEEIRTSIRLAKENRLPRAVLLPFSFWRYADDAH